MPRTIEGKQKYAIFAAQFNLLWHRNQAYQKELGIFHLQKL